MPKSSLAALLLFVAATCNQVACSSNAPAKPVDPDESKVRASIDANLNRDSDVTKVESFLKSNSYEYSVDSKTGRVRAIKRNVASQGFVTKSISVTFKISDGKFDGYETTVVWTGP